MSGHEKKLEALFNEIKGSLFEFLVAQEVARALNLEAAFLRALPPQYQAVLTQQDRMTRELYPELVRRLPLWATHVTRELLERHPVRGATGVRLTGQFGATPDDLYETDFVVESAAGDLPVSLKLNKRGGLVNTKSGGIKSFLTTYFPGALAGYEQELFSRLVDTRYAALVAEMHDLQGLTPTEGWGAWRRAGLSELPGELAPECSAALHRFHHELAQALQGALQRVAGASPESFLLGLRRLLGLGLEGLVQVICFHDLHGKHPDETTVLVHELSDAQSRLQQLQWSEAREVSSFTLRLGDWELHVRIKPMNKFTTTAIKINCSVKY